MDEPVRRGRKARQDLVRPLRGGEGRPVDHAPQLRQLHRLQGAAAEDVDVLRPGLPGVGAPGGKGIVVAGGDEHRAGQGGQGLPQPLQGLRIHPLPVEEIPGKQHHVHLPLPGQGGQAVQNFPALPPPLAGLLRGQAAEGAV